MIFLLPLAGLFFIFALILMFGPSAWLINKFWKMSNKSQNIAIGVALIVFGILYMAYSL